MSSEINKARRLEARRLKVNPLGRLNHQTLSQSLDRFAAGYLREAANAWEFIEERDDLLRAVISKRKKSVARHGWTIAMKPGLNREEEVKAKEHAAALEYFYNHLECEHAIDVNERGGFKLLVRQMMDAVGKKFAVHEIVWRAENLPDGERESGARLAATFRFVPLHFFENTEGDLRFLETESSLEGAALQPGSWMVTVGEGLMVASSIAWMFKNTSLNDWAQFSDRNGHPALRGVCAGTPGSAEWEALESAVADLLGGGSVVTSAADDVRVLDLAAGNHPPFPQLVERMDRMMAALWRGADLSTISRDRGYGASLQEKESCLLEEDDAEMITETLNRYVDEWVIRHTFGEEARPLARVKVLAAPKECTTQDLQVDEFLLRHGAPLPLQETMHRYGRTPAKAGEAHFQRFAARPQNAAEMEMENCGGVVASRGLSVALPEVRGGSAAAPIANQWELLQPEWLQLTPYGEFPHARGLQQVDRLAAEAMVAQFQSFSARLGRLFGGLPFYVGHPDMPSASDTADRKAYGWIHELEAREDGLYARVQWSEAGIELQRQGHFKFFSPYWEAKEIGKKEGQRVYRPMALISAGLTNQPNLPVRPLANESRDETPEAGASADGPAEAVFENAATLLRDVTVNEALANALREGRMRPAEESAWRDRLGNDIAEGLREPGRLPRIIPVESSTRGLGRRKREMASFISRQDRIQDYLLGKMRAGLSYDEAWMRAKREHPAWFGE